MNRVRRENRRSKQENRWLPALAAAAALVTAILVARLLTPVHPPRAPVQPRPLPRPAKSVVVRPPVPPFRNIVYPTPQTRLLDNPAAFQPTASGKTLSGRYGFVRTGRFHEGIDIAALKRGSGGRPLDQVRAIASGTVGYINAVPGNSNYGNYVVLVHDDPLGKAYTLYAHLASVAPGLGIGQRVEAATPIGTMGNTPASVIPMARAHLHFEIGLISNSRFREWFLGRGLKPDHGMFNGWNLIGINPLPVFEAYQRSRDFSLREHIRAIPVMFKIVLSTPRQLDFFQRYQQLWSGPAFDGGPIVLTCSESGLPIEGRNANEAEKKVLGRSRKVILSANESVLGRSGGNFITRSGSEWRLGRHGELWLDILTY